MRFLREAATKLSISRRNKGSISARRRVAAFRAFCGGIPSKMLAWVSACRISSGFIVGGFELLPAPVSTWTLRGGVEIAVDRQRERGDRLIDISFARQIRGEPDAFGGHAASRRSSRARNVSGTPSEAGAAKSDRKPGPSTAGKVASS